MKTRCLAGPPEGAQLHTIIAVFPLKESVTVPINMVNQKR